MTEGHGTLPHSFLSVAIAMPELPDITIYVEALERYIAGRRVEGVRIASPFVVRTYDPPVRAIEGRTVCGVRRLGKQLVLAVDVDLFLVLHLMIAGRLHWRPKGANVAARVGLGALDFDSGTLILTEASTKKRASLHIVHGEEALAGFDRGGLDVLACSAEEFRDRLVTGRHTLKRALTDPERFSGIGNAYSDEILHRARLSPLQLTPNLTPEEHGRLFWVARAVLSQWIERLRREWGERFPERVTAFHQGMAVHGRYRRPCPDCGAPVQRIVHGEHETNYCPPCQTGGRLLADRALSRLLKQDWPRSLDELDTRRTARREAVAAARVRAVPRPGR